MTTRRSSNALGIGYEGLPLDELVAARRVRAWSRGPEYGSGLVLEDVLATFELPPILPAGTLSSEKRRLRQQLEEAVAANSDRFGGSEADGIDFLRAATAALGSPNSPRPVRVSASALIREQPEAVTTRGSDGAMVISFRVRGGGQALVIDESRARLVRVNIWIRDPGVSGAFD